MEQVVWRPSLEISQTTWIRAWVTSSHFEGKGFEQEDDQMIFRGPFQCKLFCDSTKAMFQLKWIYRLLPKCLWIDLFSKFKNKWITHSDMTSYGMWHMYLTHRTAGNSCETVQHKTNWLRVQHSTGVPPRYCAFGTCSTSTAATSHGEFHF